jgi:hypothetical protein
MFGVIAKGAEADATLYRSNTSHKVPFNASARWSIGGQGSFTLIGLNMIQANSEPSDGVAHTPFDGN